MQQEAPQVSSAKAISLARMMERVGGIAGTAIAAVLSASLGYRAGAASLGIVVIVIGMGTLPLMRFFPAVRGAQKEVA